MMLPLWAYFTYNLHVRWDHAAQEGHEIFQPGEGESSSVQHLTPGGYGGEPGSISGVKDHDNFW